MIIIIIVEWKSAIQTMVKWTIGSKTSYAYNQIFANESHFGIKQYKRDWYPIKQKKKKKKKN